MIWPQPLLHRDDLVRWRTPADALQLLPPGYAGLRWHGSGAAALAALCEERLAIRGGGPLNLWLPAYFCGQSLRYLRSLPVRLHFYALGDDLLPDYDALRRRSAGAPPDMLIHVHYFGRIAGQRQSRAFADDAGAILVEDCAHVISPLVQREWVGDYLVFAPHKLFPLPGIGLALGRQPFACANGLPNAAIPWGWFLRQAARRCRRRAPATRWGLAWGDAVSPPERDVPCGGATRAASASLADFAPAAAARRDNAARLHEKLGALPGWKPLFPEGGEAVPYLIGMQCDTAALARARFGTLNRRVRLAMQWPDLPAEIRSLPDLAESCGSRVERTLFFFVHQRLETARWLGEAAIALNDDGFCHDC